MSQGGIILHKTLGVNPRMTVCRYCGKDGDELMMLGIKNYKDICDSCGLVHYGGTQGRNCQKCGGHCKRIELTDGEKVPAMGPCKECQKSLDEQNEEMKKGGVAFKCKDCGGEGMIKHDHPFCADFREKNNTPAPEPVGVEFSKENCPCCGQED